MTEKLQGVLGTCQGYLGMGFSFIRSLASTVLQDKQKEEPAGSKPNLQNEI